MQARSISEFGFDFSKRVKAMDNMNIVYFLVEQDCRYGNLIVQIGRICQWIY